MSQPFIGEILTFAGTFAPVNYVLCAGQLLPISQYNALYSLIGTTFGGDGLNTFAVPDLRSRVPIHMGQGNNLSSYVIGELSGMENVPLSTRQLPAHNHPVAVVTGQGGNLATPGVNAYLADEFQSVATVSTYLPYDSANQQVALASATITQVGESLPHDNIQPVQALLYCIAVNGIFPTRN
jgi:microcystin-dependent protein